jgi:hypothetical protein
MATLLGNDTLNTGAADSSGGGFVNVSQFTAVASGTVDTLWAYETTIADSAVTGVVLGLFSDNGSTMPGSHLGSGTASGRPAANTWIQVTGLSIPVTNGTLYWIAYLVLAPSGASVAHYNDAASVSAFGTFDPTGGQTSVSGLTTADFNSPAVSNLGGNQNLYASGTPSGGASPSPPPTFRAIPFMRGH